MDQMEAWGQFQKRLKENSQSKQAVNLSSCLEEEKESYATLQQAGTWWAEVHQGKKSTEFPSARKGKLSFMPVI